MEQAGKNRQHPFLRHGCQSMQLGAVSTVNLHDKVLVGPRGCLEVSSYL